MDLLSPTEGFANPHDVVEVCAHPYAHRTIRPWPRPSASRPNLGASRERLIEPPDSIRFLQGYDGTDGLFGVTPPLVREGVADLLVRAQASLPQSLSLVVLDAWRPLALQRALMAHYGAEATSNGYVSSASEPGFVPPHVSGGAVDLTLDAGRGPLALGTQFDDFTTKAHATSLESNPMSLDCRLRRLLFWAMVEAGFAPLSIEWWHYSYGDQNWADYFSLPQSLYGAATPV